LKNALCGPYAAIGDSFFWGGIVAVRLGRRAAGRYESVAAPLIAFCCTIRDGFMGALEGIYEGYRLGKMGIDFVRRLDLLGKARKIRWISLSFLALLAAFIASKDVAVPLFPWCGRHENRGAFCILCASGPVKKGVSPAHILYGMVVIVFLLCTVK
jgi:PTS system mannose-specific IID component